MLLLHEGGLQNAPFSRGFMDVNKCENFTGPDLLDIVNRLDPAVDVVVSAHTHQPYVCRFNDRLVTSAASFGRLITSIDLTIDRRAGKMVDATAENHVVTQTVAKDPGATSILAEYKKISDPIGEPGDRLDHGGHPVGARHGQRHQSGRRAADGRRDRRRDVRGDEGAGLRRCGRAFMNVGGVRASLLYNQISGGEKPGEVTYAEAFAVQPFGNTLVVKTCTGQQLVRRARAAVREPGCEPAARHGGLAGDVLLHAGRAASVRSASSTASLKIGGVDGQQGGRVPRRAEQLHRRRW